MSKQDKYDAKKAEVEKANREREAEEQRLRDKADQKEYKFTRKELKRAKRM